MLPFKENVIAHDWISIYIASKENGVEYIKEPLLDYRLHTTNQFGGRSFKQNISLWKKKGGNSYSSYLTYRNKVIEDAYLKGSKMCFAYGIESSEMEEEKKVIQYYETLLKVKMINIRLHSYVNYLYCKGGIKRALKEIILFHFPILGYMFYVIG